jgi:hypothetical protein
MPTSALSDELAEPLQDVAESAPAAPYTSGSVLRLVG